MNLSRPLSFVLSREGRGNPKTQLGLFPYP
jgi:hypothetical protein